MRRVAIRTTAMRCAKTYVNQRILDYSGARLEDFKHGGWQTFHHPDDLSETVKAFYHAIQTGTSYHAVLRSGRSNRRNYSITSSAQARSIVGTSRPNALAVLRLTASSYHLFCLDVRRFDYLTAF